MNYRAVQGSDFHYTKSKERHSFSFALKGGYQMSRKSPLQHVVLSLIVEEYAAHHNKNRSEVPVVNRQEAVH